MSSAHSLFGSPSSVSVSLAEQRVKALEARIQYLEMKANESSGLIEALVAHNEMHFESINKLSDQISEYQRALDGQLKQLDGLIKGSTVSDKRSDSKVASSEAVFKNVSLFVYNAAVKCLDKLANGCLHLNRREGKIEITFADESGNSEVYLLKKDPVVMQGRKDTYMWSCIMDGQAGNLLRFSMFYSEADANKFNQACMGKA